MKETEGREEQHSSIICSFETVDEDQSAAGPDGVAIASCETVLLDLFWKSKENALGIGICSPTLEGGPAMDPQEAEAFLKLSPVGASQLAAGLLMTLLAHGQGKFAAAAVVLWRREVEKMVKAKEGE